MTLAEYRARLVEHIGGHPNPAQEILIQRAVMLSAHLSRLDQEAFRSGTAVSGKYIALSNALTRTIRALGVDGPAAPAERVSLADILGAAEAQPVA